MASENDLILSSEALQCLHPTLVAQLKTIVEDNMSMAAELKYLKEETEAWWMEKARLQQIISSLQEELHNERDQNKKLLGRLEKIGLEFKRKQGVEDRIKKLLEGDGDDSEEYSPEDYDNIDSGGGNKINLGDDDDDECSSSTTSKSIEGDEINTKSNFAPPHEKNGDSYCDDANTSSGGDFTLFYEGVEGEGEADHPEMDIGPVKLYYDPDDDNDERYKKKMTCSSKTPAGPGRPRKRPHPDEVDHFEMECSSPPQCSCGKQYQLRGRLLNHIHNVPNRNRKRGLNVRR